jgi:hypothetical protein
MTARVCLTCVVSLGVGCTVTVVNLGGSAPDGDSGVAEAICDAGPVGPGTLCDPSSAENSSADTICAPAGFYCNVVQQDEVLPDGGLWVTATCELPGEFMACSSCPGCATGFACVPSDSQGQWCVQPCETTQDCSSAYTVCVPNALASGRAGCLRNFCGSNDGSDYYGPCTAEQTGDGVCCPVQDGGLCYQAGPIAPDQPCSNRRSDGGASLCQRGFLCILFPAIKNPPPTACLQACSVASSPQVQPCPDGSVCQGLGSGQLGVCLEACGGSSSACPPPLSCALLYPSLTPSFCEP